MGPGTGDVGFWGLVLGPCTKYCLGITPGEEKVPPGDVASVRLNSPFLWHGGPLGLGDPLREHGGVPRLSRWIQKLQGELSGSEPSFLPLLICFRLSLHTALES